MKLFILLIAFCVTLPKSSQNESTYNIVLMGSNGDLAKRYLWKVFYDLWNVGGYKLNLFAGSRKPGLNVRELLDDSIGTKRDQQFDSFVQGFSLRNQEDFTQLCQQYLMEDAVFHIFYLAIPPYGFETAVKNIASECSHQVKSGKIKIILEKPFGEDFSTANEMVKAISQHIPEEFLYRIDHYLGKHVLRDTINFRHSNPQVENLLNNRYVERIDVVMQESIAVEGRSSYYDQYGVIRDIHQNHLTEMLLPVVAELPNFNQSSDQLSHQLSANKIDILQKLDYVGSPLVAQYSTYSVEETGRSNETHTFAAVQLMINSVRWRNVPIVMLSGKKMGVKGSYIRIIFKKGKFPSFINNLHTESSSDIQDLILLLGSDSKQLKTGIICPISFQCLMDHRSDYEKFSSIPTQFPFLMQESNRYSIWSPVRNNEAYYNLIEDAILSERHQFISAQHLLTSWRLWSDILLWAEISPIKYCPNIDCYNFFITQYGLQWENKNDFLIPPSKSSFIRKHSISQFNQDLLVGPWASLVLRLFDRIVQSSQRAIKERGSFHLALPGGSSPRLLFNLLAYSHKSLSDIPWNLTHIWLTDERLVTRWHLKDANIQLLESRLLLPLLRNSELSVSNIHYLPLPTRDSEFEKICDSYNDLLKYHLESSSEFTFDEVILGIGSDGHIASLFPQNIDIDREVTRLAHCSNSPESVEWQRVTLSYKAITAARQVSLLLSDEKGSNSAKTQLARTILSLTDDTKLDLNEPCGAAPFCHLLKSSNKKHRNLILIDKRLIV